MDRLKRFFGADDLTELVTMIIGAGAFCGGMIVLAASVVYGLISVIR